MDIKLESPIKGAILKKWPEGDILQFFGESWRVYSVRKFKDYDGNTITQQGHSGIDFRPKKYIDCEILACHDGYIYDTGEVANGGKYVRIKSNRTNTYYMTIYGHLKNISVKNGQEVKAGDKIGILGNTGYILHTKEASIKSVQTWGNAPAEYGNHLHLTLRVYTNGRLDITNGYFGAIDSMKYLINKNMIENCIIHNTAVSYDKNPDQWIATNEYHKKKWNFKSSLGFYVGYHYEIAKDGTVRQARKDDEQGAHTIGYNHNSIGIVLDGDFENEFPTKEQTDSLKKLVTRLNKLYNFKKIGGHRDFNPRTCPGKFMPPLFIKNLIIKDMEYVKSVMGEQYLLDNTLMIKLNIGDPEELEILKKRGLKGSPAERTNEELDKYESYPLVRKKRIARNIGEFRDVLGL